MVIYVTGSSRAFPPMTHSRLCLLREFVTVSNSFFMGKEFVQGLS